MGDFVCEPTRFIQYATLNMLQAKSEQPDAVRIFVTDKAKDANWNKSITQRLDFRINKTVPYTGLESVLEYLGDKIEAVSVPDGGNEAEMWDIFNKVYNEIAFGDELYIDLTHAFRYLPMLMLVLSNYAKFLKNVTVTSITYGNFEARDRDTNIAPFVNLLPLTKLQDWTTAAADFKRNGYTDSLVKLAKEKLAPLCRPEADNPVFARTMRDIVIKLNTLADERLTCRGMDVVSGSTLNNLDQLMADIDNTGIAPLTPIMDEVKANLNASISPSKRCLDAARWCYNRHLYQQAITFLQEGITTYFCIRHSIDIDHEDLRGYVNKAFRILTPDNQGNLLPKDKLDQVAIPSLLEALVNDEMIANQELVNIFNAISEVRNDFNHSGFRSKKAPLKATDIKKKIDELLNKVETILQPIDREVCNTRAIFINLSNHPSAKWKAEQLSAAKKKFGQIVDFDFPAVSPDANPVEITALAQQTVDTIIQQYGGAYKLTVHIMGEMTLTFALVSQLKAKGIRCVASTTERLSEDLPDGSKRSDFKFVSFREY